MTSEERKCRKASDRQLLQNLKSEIDREVEQGFVTFSWVGPIVKELKRRGYTAKDVAEYLGVD